MSSINDVKFREGSMNFGYHRGACQFKHIAAPLYVIPYYST